MEVWGQACPRSFERLCKFRCHDGFFYESLIVSVFHYERRIKETFRPEILCTYQWRPHAKSVKPVAHATPRRESRSSTVLVMTESITCLPMAESTFRNGRTIIEAHDMLDVVGRRRRMRDGDGTLRDRRPAREESLEEVLGKKRSGYTLRMARNGIPAKTSGTSSSETRSHVQDSTRAATAGALQTGTSPKAARGEAGSDSGVELGFRARHRAQGGHGDFRQGFADLWRRSPASQDYPHLLRKAREAVRFSPSSSQRALREMSTQSLQHELQRLWRSIAEAFRKNIRSQGSRKKQQAAEADAASRGRTPFSGSAASS